jgi:hypothetical protein
MKLLMKLFSKKTAQQVKPSCAKQGLYILWYKLCEYNRVDCIVFLTSFDFCLNCGVV